MRPEQNVSRSGSSQSNPGFQTQDQIQFAETAQAMRPFHHAFLSHSVPVSFCSNAIKSPTLHNPALCHKYDQHSRATVLFGDATW